MFFFPKEIWSLYTSQQMINIKSSTQLSIVITIHSYFMQLQNSKIMKRKTTTFWNSPLFCSCIKRSNFFLSRSKETFHIFVDASIQLAFFLILLLLRWLRTGYVFVLFYRMRLEYNPCVCWASKLDLRILQMFDLKVTSALQSSCHGNLSNTANHLTHDVMWP